MIATLSDYPLQSLRKYTFFFAQIERKAHFFMKNFVGDDILVLSSTNEKISKFLRRNSTRPVFFSKKIYKFEKKFQRKYKFLETKI